MDLNQAKEALKTALDDEMAVVIPPPVLRQLHLDDIPEGAWFQVGVEENRVVRLDWSGRLCRRGSVIEGEAEEGWTRKYWYSPVGLEQYMDLVRRSVEARHRMRGDVEVIHYDDDGAYIQLYYAIRTGESVPFKAFQTVQRVSGELEEAAQRATAEVGTRIAEVAARLSGWGSEPLDRLVEKVETADNSDDKGRSLEELASRLFEQVPGFSVTGRLRTATEEIDISILNDSVEPRLRRESAIILAECKNWNTKCGKDEFVTFREKLENRNRRCSLGFLVSWNGFTNTVTKEMLRGSREDTLIVPMSGVELRNAARSGDMLQEIIASWDKAVTL